MVEDTAPEPAASESPGTSRFSYARTIHAKLVQRGVGRALISVALVVTLAAIFVANMPDSVIKKTLLVPAQPYLSALGLGEDWGVFAPNPRTQVIFATGRIAYSDGTASVWSFPIRPGIMSYSDYRWQKFEEHVRLDDFRGLWKPFSEYLLRREATPGKTPVQVALMRRWAQIEPPGTTPALSPWKQYVYFVMPVGGAR
jgi:hypothetical protein